MIILLLPIFTLIAATFIQTLNFKKENRILSILGFVIAFAGTAVFWTILFNNGFTGGLKTLIPYLKGEIQSAASEATVYDRIIYVFGQGAIMCGISMVIAALFNLKKVNQ